MSREAEGHSDIPDAAEAAASYTVARGAPAADVNVRVPAAAPHMELLASLSEVAAAVSSQQSIDEVLNTVVDEAKRVLGTGKAVLCLIDEHNPEAVIDASAMVVRGRRREHPESWWRKRIEGIAPAVLGEGTPQLAWYRQAWLLCVPVKVKAKPIGLLSAIAAPEDAFSEDKIMLLAILGAFAGSAIENARLASRSRYALLASERSRISKEMHDGLAQSLFTVSLGLEVCKKRVTSDPEDVAKRLDDIQTLTRESLTELRRYIYDLRPASLEKLGLVGSIDLRLREAADGRGLRTSLEVKGDARDLEPGIEAAVYRVAQEAISNAARHSGGERIDVRLTYGSGDLTLIVKDDGHGFDVGSALASADRGRSLGLKSIRERAEAEGGTVTIASVPHGGTTLKVRVRCSRRSPTNPSA